MKIKNKPWICKKCGKPKRLSFWSVKTVPKRIKISLPCHCDCNKKKLTMDDEYGDGSKHLCCPKCHYCITCGDCICRQGWEPKHKIE